MKTVIISYSFTGNNLALEKSLAKKIDAKHFQVTEPQTRTIGKIILDIVFNLTPKINQIDYSQISSDDLIIFIGPVWIGKISTPLRSCFKYFKKQSNNYIFVTISGGAMGPNSKISKELEKRLGRKPVKVLDLLIAKLFLPQNPKPTSEETSKYHLSQKNIEELTNIVITQIT